MKTHSVGSSSTAPVEVDSGHMVVELVGTTAVVLVVPLLVVPLLVVLLLVPTLVPDVAVVSVS